MKSVQIRSFFWSIFSRILTEYGDLLRKYRPEIAPYLDSFHTEKAVSKECLLVILDLFKLWNRSNVFVEVSIFTVKAVTRLFKSAVESNLWKPIAKDSCPMKGLFVRQIVQSISMIWIQLFHGMLVDMTIAKNPVKNSKKDSHYVKVSGFGVILVCIFPHLEWIRRDTLYFSVFTSNERKCDPE